MSLMNIRSSALAITLTILVKLLITSNSIAQEVESESTNKVVLSSDVEWEQLNPARGENSPLAGTLWGDRKADVATGYLGKFVDGFSSPPHIHNVTYRAIVIKGTIHNDDPSAEKLWMKPGSFWTQPQGEAHITAAKGIENIAYIEIDNGPYLVKPTDEAFDNGERPVNIDASNIVWVDASNLTWIEQTGLSGIANEIKVAFLWGKPGGDHMNGRLIKLPAGFTGKIISHGSAFHGVVIKGQPQYKLNDTEFVELEPGSYFSATGKSIHQVNSNTDEESIIYLRTNGKLEVIPTHQK